MGNDEHGWWFGTRAAPVTIEDYDEHGRMLTRKRVFTLEGYFLGESFSACVRASSEERVHAYFYAIGVRDITVWPGFL